MITQLAPFPTLHKIDPCEGCTRNCHDCGFKEEHFKLMDQATREKMKNDYLKLHEMPKTEYVPHDHGTHWNDCSICDTEITDRFSSGSYGKLVDITIAGRHSIIHICNSCYLDSDFQENIRKDINVKIRNY